MNCIVNVDENWGIGQGNQLLFSISADLKRFRELTTGKTVILGRKTLATFPGGRPLKNRINLVLSASRKLVIDGATIVHDAQELLSACRACDTDDLCVIGGASVYKLLLPYCQFAQVTKTYHSAQADCFFPNLDLLPGWHPIWRSGPLEENGVLFEYWDYENDTPITLMPEI